MSIRNHIPNSITLGNLFCGCLALVNAFEGRLDWAAYFVGIALILDFFDGFTARMLKVSSNIGKDLDSLADMVTFGVVPGVVMFKMLLTGMNLIGASSAVHMGWAVTASSLVWVPYMAFIITIFSCIRLAKFNNDTRQSDSFIGLPTPANTMVICALPLIVQFQSQNVMVINLISNVWFLVLLSITMSCLLVAEIPLFALKFKTFGWAKNKLVYLFLCLSVFLMVWLKFLAIPLIIFLYISVSIVNNIFLKNKV